MTNYRPETDRFFEKVDRRDGGCWMWTASVTPDTGYGQFMPTGQTGHIGAHRWSYEYHKGPIPKDMVIDHTCHQRACVNPDHLRLATRAQNNQNRGILNRTNKTGYRGVYFCKRTRLYAAQVYINGRAKFLGRYSTAEAAAEVARLARLEAYTHNDLDRTA